jgi:nucleotide-binding universal stress UspA family protein
MSRGSASTVLVPVDVSAAEIPPTGVLDLLGGVNVLLLGYYPVPSQAAPAQIKAQHGSEAAERLEAVRDAIARRVDTVAEELCYTHDREETIDRIADEYGCTAVLRLGPADSVDRILVPFRGDSNVDSILELVGDLLGAGNTSVTLFHSVEEGTDQEYGETLLADAADRLSTAGVDPTRIDRRLSVTVETGVDIVTAAGEFDVVVLGETDPSLRDRILGAVQRETLSETNLPVFVVRNTDA